VTTDDGLRHLPGWGRDVAGTLAIHPQFVLWGNVRDFFLIGPEEDKLLMPFLDAIRHVLATRGVEAMLVHDRVDGLRLHGGTGADAAQEVLGQSFEEPRVMSLEALRPHLVAVARTARRSVAVVLDYASRLVVDPENPGPEERDLYIWCEKLANSAKPVQGPEGVSLHNPIIWTVSREQDMPAWFVADNESVRVIPVPLPDLGDRKQAAEIITGGLTDGLDEAVAAGVVEDLADASDGLSLRAMFEIVRLAEDRQVLARDVTDAVRAYKVGLVENPWTRGYLPQRIRNGEQELRRTVLGQEPAVTKTLDILKRSVMGLSGAQARGSTRPRGVLFFAGPTGVGKTELAKGLTRLVFGDQSAYHRFDMSEFSAEHADQRLVGAPPGYVGFDAGGELTNAARTQPFSLFLFDEIEKAHPRVLDKFLQILDDGRLTDGRGTTVHFTEALIVFTSNLGMYVPDAAGQPVANVTMDDDFEVVEARLRAAIMDHFNRVLNRPELLNRIGDNIVIFDFIRPPIDEAIFHLLVGNIAERIQDQHDVALELSDKARSQLLAVATRDLSQGGRGIGSRLETWLVNPLARAMFDQGVTAGQPITIRSLDECAAIPTVVIS
jgi:ATP-dependent Clp protease ATP-binding subunit ClpB